MFNYLLLLQYPLIYLPMLIIGLVIYGSDFKSVAGGFYLVAVVGVPLVTGWRWSMLSQLQRIPAVSVAVVGLLSAFWLYRDLHFAVWDEHAWFQAALVMVLGFASSLLSMRAAGNLAPWQGNHSRALFLALVVVASAWWVALAFPFFPFLVVALLLLWAVYIGEFSTKVPIDAAPLKDGLSRYALFLAAFQVFLPVWDYRMDTHWALLLAISLLSAALSSLFVKRMGGLFRVLLIVGLTVDWLATVLWPEWTITDMQAVISGVFFGLFIGIILRSYLNTLAQNYILYVVNPVLFGMLLGVLFYTNYVYTQWRLLLISPLIYLAFCKKKSAKHISQSKA